MSQTSGNGCHPILQSTDEASSVLLHGNFMHQRLSVRCCEMISDTRARSHTNMYEAWRKLVSFVPHAMPLQTLTWIKLQICMDFSSGISRSLRSYFYLADMAPRVIRAPQQRIVTDELFDIVLQKVTTESKLHQPVTFSLVGANLQFRHFQKLIKHFEQTQTRVFALDMSMNRIQADWASLNVEVNRLLGPGLVLYLDLGMNYLPAISSLDQSESVRHNFLQLGQRLSLALDCDSYTGVADVDWWIRNARTFKTEAYGITEFAEDPDDM